MAPSDSFYLPVNYGFKQHNQFSLIRLSNEAKLVQEGGMERVPKWQSSGKAVWASCRESRGRRITTIGCGLALLDTNDTWRWSTTQIRKRSYTTLFERKRFLYASDIIILLHFPRFFSPISPPLSLRSASFSISPTLRILPFPPPTRATASAIPTRSLPAVGFRLLGHPPTARRRPRRPLWRSKRGRSGPAFLSSRLPV
jgi:hypothetical protein